MRASHPAKGPHTRPTMAPIVLLTDFGLEDTYVGVMKGVISGIAPEARVIDLTHGVPPGDIRQAAFKLWQAVGFFPAGSVFVIVVDPGVGTARRPVTVKWRSARIVAPDNGILTYLTTLEPISAGAILEDDRYQLEQVSSTFHGRDIFAPVGAHLWNGVPLDRLGPPLADPVTFPLPALEARGSSLAGEILHADRFGNLITSIGRLRTSEARYHFAPWFAQAAGRKYPAGQAIVRLPDGRQLPLHSTFGDVPPGDPVAYIGSEGLLEIAINGGSAGQVLGYAGGDRVELNFEDGHG